MKRLWVFGASCITLLILGIGLLLEKGWLESLAEEQGAKEILSNGTEFVRAENAEFVANLYLSHRKYEDALLLYNQILKTNSRTQFLSNIRFNIANIYNIQGSSYKAIETYEEIIRLSKESYPQAVAGYKIYEEKMKPYQEAMRTYSKEMREFRKKGGDKPPGQPVPPVIEKPKFLPPQTLEMNIIRAYLSIANIYKTLPLCGMVAHGKVYPCRDKNSHKDGDAEAAFKKMAQESLTEEFTWLALFSLAGLYESTGEYDKSLESYQQLLDLNFQRGSIYYPVLTTPVPGRTDVFIEHITPPSVLSSRPGTILGLMANAYERQGRFDKAIETYKRIIEDKSSQDTDISTAWFFMGNLYERLGNRPESIKSFKAVVEMGQGISIAPGTKQLSRQIRVPYSMQLDRLVAVARTKLEALRGSVPGETQ